MTISIPTAERQAGKEGVTLHENVSDEFVRAFREDGFAILRDTFSAAEVDEMNAEALRLCRGELGEIRSSRLAPEGSTVSGVAPDESDADVLRRFLCVHFPDKISAVARKALAHPLIVRALTRVIGPNVKAMQSMLFIKSEGKPGQAWHQDEYFIPTRDRSLTAVWIALDDATVENGCLWVIPGSHKRGVLYPDREQDDPAFDCTREAYGFPYTDEDAIPVEIPAGTAVFFNGYLLHRSLQNSGKHGYRRALANHYMSAESLLPWRTPPEGVHIGKWDFRDITMVAGEDPYAYKGTPVIHRTHTRPDKEGGCEK